MIGVVYLGNNPQTEERLKYLPGRQVQLTKNYKETAAACESRTRNEHFIVFYEKGEQAEDITAITYLRKNCKNIYIIFHRVEVDEMFKDIPESQKVFVQKQDNISKILRD